MDYQIRVETHSGYKTDEYPVRFWIDNSQLEIIEIEDRWYSPGYSYFKIFADNARHYILKRSNTTGIWIVQEINV